MKRIKVCIASSAANLRTDRMEIVNFFRRLNEYYLDRDLYFSLIMSEDTDDFPLQLTDSDLAFFVFATIADWEALAAFDVAMESYRKNNRPKIITYFKREDGQPPTEEIEQLRERLNRETDFYYNTYGHIDTLKLGVLMQIRQLDLDGVDIRLENSKAWQGSMVLLSLENVEMVSGYEELQRLKSERAELESRFYAAKLKYAESPEDNQAYEAFFEAAKQRNKAIQVIRDMETRLYHMIEGMYEQTARGRLSKRQIEGYHLVERGRFKEAQAVLDFDSIVNESRHDEALADMVDKRAQVHVNEQLLLVEVNKTLGDWEGADACYKEAVHLEQRHSLPKKAMYAYAEFLYNQNRYAEGITVAEKLRSYYQHPEDKASDVDMGNLLDLLGMFYRGTQLLRESEEMHKAVLELRQRLVAQNNEAFDYERTLANSYHNLGKLYIEAKRLAEATEMNLAAIKIREKLVSRNPEAIEPELAAGLNNLGAIYQLTQRRSEAEQMYKAAIEIRKRLVYRGPDIYEPQLASTYNNLGLLYCENNHMAGAEEMHLAALEVRRRLADRNPDAYEPALEMSYINLGLLYTLTNRMAEAEATYKLALNLQLKLVGRKRDIYEPDLVLIYNNLGGVYCETQRWAEAEEMHKAALETALKLTKSNSDTFEPDLANTYLYLGAAYLGAKRMVEAEKTLNIALDLYKKQVDRTPNAYEPKLAKNYCYLGMLYRETQRMTLGEEMLGVSLELRKKLAADSPDAYEPALADSYFEFGELFRATHRISQAEEAYRTALQLYEKYAQISQLCARDTVKTRNALERLGEIPLNAERAQIMDLFTPEEREIALLLAGGDTQRDIARKLKLTAAEVKQQIEAIRDKVFSLGEPDPAIAAIVQEFRLSRQEERILRCLRRGMSNADIAAELFIAEETVRYHVHKLLKKLPVEKRQDIAAWSQTFAEPKE